MANSGSGGGAGARAAAPAAAKVAPKKKVTATRSSPAKTGASRTSPSPRGVSSTAPSSKQNDKVDELSTRVTELQLTIDGLEKERDFYFGKLRDIEVRCDAHIHHLSPHPSLPRTYGHVECADTHTENLRFNVFSPCRSCASSPRSTHSRSWSRS